MIVMKFGGTSVGDAARIRQACGLVRERLADSPMVVVSALAGVTNRLVAVSEAARSGDAEGVKKVITDLRERHATVIHGLGLAADVRERLEAVIASRLDHAARLAEGMRLLGETTPRAQDALLATGELIAHAVFAATLESTAVAAEPLDPQRLLVTDGSHGEAVARLDATTARCAELVAPRLARHLVPVTGGFVGATEDGTTTTLGRGGSDLSATLFGVALGAREVQIWTDVDGMMTADPRVVPAARTLASVSFQEASELAYFGAKVLHPATIRPAVEKRIPVRILNTMRPEGAGTVVDQGPADPGEPCVRAVAWKDGIATLHVSSPRMLGATGFLARVFEVFEQHRTPVDVVTTSEVSVSMTVDRAERLADVERELSTFSTVRVERDASLVCVVGRRLLERPDLVGELLRALSGIPLRMFCLGSSSLNVSLVVEQRDAVETVRRLHRRFVEDAP